jgi:hypothetical protein
MKTTKELRQRIKSIISNIPSDICEYYSNRPYELMIYIKRGDDDFDLDDFTTFKGIRELDKSINKIIDNYKENLFCIDFKWSMREDDYDQFTIYKN